MKPLSTKIFLLITVWKYTILKIHCAKLWIARSKKFQKLFLSNKSCERKKLCPFSNAIEPTQNRNTNLLILYKSEKLHIL